MESDKAEIKKRLDMVGLAENKGSLQQQRAGFTLVHLVLIALLAFALGYLLP